MSIEHDRAELWRLKAELERVQWQVNALRERATVIEGRFAVAPEVVAAPEPERVPPIILPEVAAAAAVDARREPGVPKVVAGPIAREVFEAEPVRQTRAAESEPEAVAAGTTEAGQSSLEMRLGTFWFVRIGVVMVLTALVFLGNFAYQKYIPLLGAGGKVALLYLASGTLVGLGVWLPRRQEKLRNYGEVLFSAGLAAVYFTTYAAHHFPNVRVIESEGLAGALLLGWTAVIVFLANRRKSEAMAFFGLGLAYYASLITNVGGFTVVSNFILSAASVWFLIRNRWLALGFASLAASYGSYAYWRFHGDMFATGGVEARMALPGYWVIFTAAVFLTRHEAFRESRRAWFLSANNAAAFGLFVFNLQMPFWQPALAAGGMLLGCFALSTRWLADDALPRRAYLTQGLVLLTLGFITYFKGPNLALLLAAESLILLVFAVQWREGVLRVGSVLCAALAAGWALFSLQLSPALNLSRAGAILGLMLFNAGFARWTSKTKEEFEPTALYYSILGLAVWAMSLFQLAPAAWLGPALGLTTLALTLAFPVLRVREILLPAQALAVLGQMHALAALAQRTPSMPDWSPLATVGISVTLALWWKRRKGTEPTMGLLAESVNALAAVGIFYAWLPNQLEPATRVVTLAVLGLGVTGVAIFARSIPFVAAAQIFLIGSSGLTLALLGQGRIAWAQGLAPVAAWMALAAVAHFAVARLPEKASLLLRALSYFYQTVGGILALTVAVQFVPEAGRFLSFTVAGLGAFLVARRGALYIIPAALLFGSAGLLGWLTQSPPQSGELKNLAPILILIAAQVLYRRASGRIPASEFANRMWIMVGASALWLFVSRGVTGSGAGPGSLTAAWAGLAFVLFVFGISIREQTHRWAGLVILTAAVGRVVFLDVWRFQSFHRILSFLALGIVLLALGYIYTRYQEKISKWL